MTDATGRRPAEDQAAFALEDELDPSASLTDTEIYEGELEAGAEDRSRGLAGVEMLTDLELRADETSNPDVAAEEGMPWVPPMDPPVVPAEGPEGLEVASGFGASALDEPYDEDHRSELLSAEDEMSSRVREALRADSSTSPFEDRIVIGAVNGRVVLRGHVPDLVDSDNVVAVAERVEGVFEVIDETEVDALER